jgi:arylsulfatase A-like enzyme
VRVPLVVSSPNAASSTHRIERPVSTIDVAPTIFELAGISLPAFSGDRIAFPLAGQSLVLTQEGELPDHRNNIFFASRAFWGVRSREWKMILRTRDDEDNLGEFHQLFNLSADYEETQNLYGSEPQHAARLLRRVEARQGIQSNYKIGGTDSSNRYKKLTEEALENLRTLGYIR